MMWQKKKFSPQSAPLASVRGCEMKIGEHMEPVIKLLNKLNGDDTDASLKLLTLVIAEFMLNADVRGFDVTVGKLKVSVDISEESECERDE